MPRNAIGFVLVDAPHSALNNAGTDAGQRAENVVSVKAIRKGKKVYPYVSGQAFRYWWRKTLEEKFGWNLSPLEKVEGKSQVFTRADPLNYEDDDVFGYMKAVKKDTVTRVSPLKTSPLVSVISTYPTRDFGVAARHEGDPVPYEHEFYSTVLKGAFSLDIDQVGTFYNVNRSGYKNLYPELEEQLKKAGATEKGNKITLSKETRIKRIKETISALPYLFGGAKLSTHLTDVTPKLVILAGTYGGNHIFMNLMDEKDEKAVFNFEALKEVIDEYSDILLTDIFVGKRKGFMDEWDEKFAKLADNSDSPKIKFGPLNQMVSDFSEHLVKIV
jgi:CRISPR-associated protein Cst2